MAQQQDLKKSKNCYNVSLNSWHLMKDKVKISSTPQCEDLYDHPCLLFKQAK